MVLPSPMSSARQAPRPSWCEQVQPGQSLALIRPQRALQGLGHGVGVHAGGRRRPRNGAGSRGCRAGLLLPGRAPRAARLRSGPHVQDRADAPANRRMPSTKEISPSWACCRTFSQWAMACWSRSRSTSTHCPLSKTSASSPFKRALISSGVSGSPPRATSTLKSSSASRPIPDGVCVADGHRHVWARPFAPPIGKTHR